MIMTKIKYHQNCNQNKYRIIDNKRCCDGDYLPKDKFGFNLYWILERRNTFVAHNTPYNMQIFKKLTSNKKNHYTWMSGVRQSYETKCNTYVETLFTISITNKNNK